MNSFLDEFPILGKKYKSKFIVQNRFGDNMCTYQIVGAKGAVELNITRYKTSGEEYEYQAGLEFHFRQPPVYMKDEAPHHETCHCFNAPCWHDGTTSYAKEYYLPLFLSQSHSAIFLSMVKDADEKFEDETNE